MSSRDAMDFAVGLVRNGTLRVDADGSVWRLREVRRGQSRSATPRRAENVGGKGYLRLTLQAPWGKLVQIMAHRLVWEAANGPIPDGLQVNHKDLNRTNNALPNLEVVTASGNIRHSYAAGRRRPWSEAAEWRPGRARLTPETRTAIVSRRAEGATLPAIAAEFGLSTTHVHRICTT